MHMGLTMSTFQLNVTTEHAVAMISSGLVPKLPNVLKCFDLIARLIIAYLSDIGFVVN